MLSPTKKADRSKMIGQIKLLAATLGATCTITDESNNRLMQRAFHATVHCAHGLNASLTIDGTSRNNRSNVYVIAWHMDTTATDRLSSIFESVIGEVNRYHRQKATSIAYSFDAILKLLTIGMTMAADRRAFISETPNCAKPHAIKLREMVDLHRREIPEAPDR
jgi:hypothetical protein